MSELVQTGDFRPFLFDIFFKIEPIFDQSGDYAFVFINDDVFYIREDEMIDILENTDFPELTESSYLLIITANDDLTTSSNKTEEAIKRSVEQYLRGKSIAYEVQGIPLKNNRPFKL